MKRFCQLLVLTILGACQPVTVRPTLTSATTPAITNMPMIVPISETPTRCELRQPQPADLLKMIDSVLLIEEHMTYKEDVTTFILEREPNSLQYLIGEDFERYYLDGFSGAEDLVTSDIYP